mmetsp:Transcript_47586/g.135859  ORF Transcript_47586/g.135859 Transcript_47586/m.135859 type:complete len:320 (+) Transcript_47586:534-1493(+)
MEGGHGGGGRNERGGEGGWRAAGQAAAAGSGEDHRGQGEGWSQAAVLPAAGRAAPPQGGRAHHPGRCGEGAGGAHGERGGGQPRAPGVGDPLHHRGREAGAAAARARVHGRGCARRRGAQGVVQLDGPALGSCTARGHHGPRALQGQHRGLLRERAQCCRREGTLRHARAALRALRRLAADGQHDRQRGRAVHRQVPHLLQPSPRDGAPPLPQPGQRRGPEVAARQPGPPPGVSGLEQRDRALRAPVAPHGEQPDQGRGEPRGARGCVLLALVQRLPWRAERRRPLWAAAVRERWLLRRAEAQLRRAPGWLGSGGRASA